MFHEWYPAMMNGIGGPPDIRAAGIKANQEYHDYLEPLLQARSKDPKDDLISRLCAAEVDGHRMTFQEIKAFASLILVAGAETTDKAIANLWYEMLANPEQWELVRDDPSLLDRAFTEMMRVHGPSGGQSRLAVHDIPFPEYGVTIPEGAYVNLSIYGGNRDERVFANPDKFDITRPDLYVGKALRAGYHDNGQASHLGFGLGKHFCVGYQLAQTETVIGSRMLMDVMRNPRFSPGLEPETDRDQPQPVGTPRRVRPGLKPCRPPVLPRGEPWKGRRPRPTPQSRERASCCTAATRRSPRWRTTSQRGCRAGQGMSRSSATGASCTRRTPRSTRWSR